MQKLRQLLSQEFVKFIFAGSIAASANFFSRMLFGHLMPFASSIVCAYAVGMLTAFLLFKYLVFAPSDQSTRQEISYFILVNLVAVGLILIVSLFLYQVVLTQISDDFLRATISHAIGIGVSTLSSYVGHKLFTFKRLEA